MTNAALDARSAFGPLDPAQLGRLVDQLPVLLWSTDKELRVTFRRGGSLALLGPPPGPQEQFPIGDFIESGKEAERAIAAHRAALRGQPTAYEITVRGRTFIARVEPQRGPKGRITGVVGVAFDVTDRLRA